MGRHISNQYLEKVVRRGAFLGWRARVPKDGLRHYSETFRTKAEAAEWRDQELRAQATGMVTVKGNKTIDSFAVEWLSWQEVAARRLRPNTAEDLERYYKTYIKPELGRVKMRDFSRRHVDRWIMKLMTPKAGGGYGVSAGTARHAFANLRRCSTMR